MALSKTGRFLSKAEILGVGVFCPLSSKDWTIWHFLCFVSCVFVYQDSGHTQTPRTCHILRAFPASIQEHSPPKCLFFMANAKLPNRPGFALLPVAASGT